MDDKESRPVFGAYPQVALAEAREKPDTARNLRASDSLQSSPPEHL
ncbi:hypothetical protein [Brenneria goodwinii]